MCAQEASSTCVLSIPNARLRLSELQVRPATRCAWQCLCVARDAHRCLPAAGPRATACTPSNEPEQRDYLRFVNFIIAPDFIVLLFVFVSAGLSVCGLYVSCRVSESVLVGTRGFCIESTRHCVIRVSCYENSQRNTKSTLSTTLPVVSMCCLFCALDVSVHKPTRTRTRR